MPQLRYYLFGRKFTLATYRAFPKWKSVEIQDNESHSTAAGATGLPHQNRTPLFPYSLKQHFLKMGRDTIGAGLMPDNAQCSLRKDQGVPQLGG